MKRGDKAYSHYDEEEVTFLEWTDNGHGCWVALIEKHGVPTLRHPDTFKAPEPREFAPLYLR